jgi:hypothetical protein
VNARCENRVKCSDEIQWHSPRVGNKPSGAAIIVKQSDLASPNFCCRVDTFFIMRSSVSRREAWRDFFVSGMDRMVAGGRFFLAISKPTPEAKNEKRFYDRWDIYAGNGTGSDRDFGAEQ